MENFYRSVWFHIDKQISPRIWGVASKEIEKEKGMNREFILVINLLDKSFLCCEMYNNCFNYTSSLIYGYIFVYHVYNRTTSIASLEYDNKLVSSKLALDYPPIF